MDDFRVIYFEPECILQGLRRLQAETFVEGALGFGAQEVISTSVIHQAWSSRSEDILRNGIWGYAEGFVDFSVQSMDYWLKEFTAGVLPRWSRYVDELQGLSLSRFARED